jgi:hypothetical protein
MQSGSHGSDTKRQVTHPQHRRQVKSSATESARPGAAETVEQFLARGGQVERVAVGVLSNANPKALSAINEASRKPVKAKAGHAATPAARRET